MKKTILAILCILVAVVVSSLLVQKHLQESSVREKLLSETLKFIPSTVDEKKLTDEELRMYYYVTHHLLDPIASLAGTDTDALRTVSDVLQKDSHEISALYIDQIDSDALFPIGLQHTLADLEDLRRELVSEPTPQLATQYHEVLIQFLDLQSNNLKKVQTALASDDSGAAMWAGFVDSLTLSNRLTEVLGELENRKNEELSRYKCFSDGLSCDSLTSIERVNEPKTIERYVGRNVPDDVLFYKEFFTKYFDATKDKDFDFGEAKLPGDPLILFTESYCAIDRYKPVYAMLSEAQSLMTDVPRVQFTYLEDVYYSELHAGTPHVGLNVDASSSVPVPYAIKLQTPYTCVDSGQDIQKALSIEYIHQKLAAIKINSSDSDFKEIITLQDRITNGETIIDTDVSRLVYLLDVQLADKGTRYFENKFGDEVTKGVIDMIHTWKGQSAWFDYMVGATDSQMRPVLYIDPEGKPKLGASTFIMVRSNFVSLYQLVNTTITKEQYSFLSSSYESLDGYEIFPYSYPNVLSYKDTLINQFPTVESLLEMTLAGRKFTQKLLGL